jgi:hypothetical protein
MYTKATRKKKFPIQNELSELLGSWTLSIIWNSKY